jgi:hypothetical protein
MGRAFDFHFSPVSRGMPSGRIVAGRVGLSGWVRGVWTEDGARYPGYAWRGGSAF